MGSKNGDFLRKWKLNSLFKITVLFFCNPNKHFSQILNFYCKHFELGDDGPPSFSNRILAPRVCLKPQGHIFKATISRSQVVSHKEIMTHN